MNLLKISDDPAWVRINKRVTERVANLQSSPVPQTMTSLQTSLVSIRERKSQVEAELAALSAKEPASAWRSALAGRGDTALEARDQLRAEYAELEQRERFAESAIKEGRLELDHAHGKDSRDACDELKPDYLKLVVPKARAAARQMLEAMEIEQRFVDVLLDHGVRIDHLGRVFFPMSRERLEKFLREIEELG